jgi:Fic family protein
MRQATVDIDDRKDDLAELIEGDRALAKTFWEKLDLSWTYHENALEGVVITADEMAQAFRPGPTVAEIGKAAFLADIRRQKEAIDLAKQEAASPRGKVSLTLVKNLFETLTGGEEGKGRMDYRKDMPLHRTYFHDIAQPPKIIPDLTKLIEQANSAEFHNLHPLQQAALFHHRFMAIFPFTDLSGKVGRLVMNIMVMRAGYLPAVIHAIDRQRYYDSLKQQPRVLQALMTEAIEHATDLGFKYFTAEQEPVQAAPRSKAGNHK